MAVYTCSQCSLRSIKYPLRKIICVNIFRLVQQRDNPQSDYQSEGCIIKQIIKVFFQFIVTRLKHCFSKSHTFSWANFNASKSKGQSSKLADGKKKNAHLGGRCALKEEKHGKGVTVDKILQAPAN